MPEARTGRSPKVSIVMPVYNTAEHLDDAISSVRSQDFEDWELLVADGGSTDGSLEIARRHASSCPERIRVLEAPAGVPSKPARNRNRALREARGELVAFLDSDDLWEPTKLGRLTAIADEHPEVGLVFAYARCIDDAGRPIAQGSRAGQTGLLGAGEPGVMTDAFERMLGRRAHAQTSSVLARNELVRSVGGFDERIFPDGDTLLWTRLAREAPAYFLPEALSAKRVRAGGIVVGVTRLQDAWFRVDYLVALAKDPRGVEAPLRAAVPGALERFLDLRELSAWARVANAVRGSRRIASAFGLWSTLAVVAGLARRTVRRRIGVRGRAPGAGGTPSP